jgi:hypothetical protein
MANRLARDCDGELSLYDSRGHEAVGCQRCGRTFSLRLVIDELWAFQRLHASAVLRLRGVLARVDSALGANFDRAAAEATRTEASK